MPIVLDQVQKMCPVDRCMKRGPSAVAVDMAQMIPPRLTEHLHRRITQSFVKE
jgi:hypothetical protein